jgi:hypothetical protein
MSDPTTGDVGRVSDQVSVHNGPGRGAAFGVTPGKPYPEHLYPGCPCAACDRRNVMNLCPTCGNKRCPAAMDHARWACTGSNEYGQTPTPLAAVSAAAPDERDVARVLSEFRECVNVEKDGDAVMVPVADLRIAYRALAARPAPVVSGEASVLRQAARLVRTVWTGTTNLPDLDDQEVAYSFDVWLDRLADRYDAPAALGLTVADEGRADA